MVVVNYFKDELGVIQGTAPECVLVTVLIAVKKMSDQNKEGGVYLGSQFEGTVNQVGSQ